MRIKITDSNLNNLLLYQNQLANSQHTSQVAAPQHAQDPQLGKFLQRYLHFEHFNIAQLCWQLDQELELQTDQLEAGINMNFMLSGGIYSEFEALPQPIRLNPMEHNLLFTCDSSGTHLFPAGTLLHNLHVSLSTEYFQSICTEEFRLSDLLLNSIERQSSILASAHNGNITSHMLQTIKGILECPFEGAVQKLYLEGKVLELLALQFENLQCTKEKEARLLSKETALAEEIRLYLEQHYLELASLQQLAKMFGTNEYKLKKVFRERFGKGVFTYAQELRLVHGLDLLASGEKNVAQVAELLGYSHANHFTTAFRKHFGYPPSLVRK
ncbi:AraC family transcriptional regulator [uncultured Pontibacter sp.]|uniref:AraC family transcriptional regulator n=1 Tax=uncultured Pontibacter sp. TaxID=453356 RepID=UPI002617C1DD|nr:AraC family transcriptional regulator [uncultured Pontibacter sp.]